MAIRCQDAKSGRRICHCPGFFGAPIGRSAPATYPTIPPRVRVRVAREKYALLPRTLSGVARGGPGPRRGTRISSSRSGSICPSWPCPGATTTAVPQLSHSQPADQHKHHHQHHHHLWKPAHRPATLVNLRVRNTAQVNDTSSRRPHETSRLTAQRDILVLIPFQSLVDLLNSVVGPHLIHDIEVRID